jgi:hypothetical protein
MKTKPLLLALAVAGLSSLIAISSVHATVTNPDHAAIKPGFPTSWTEWTSADVNPDLSSCLAGECFGWNPRNVRPGNHPDRGDDDPNNPDVIYIFPSDYDFNAVDAWDGTGIPDDAVAYVHWELDNGSGEFPGIMAISDDWAFRANNCIMASGDTIPGPDGVLDTADDHVKTCSNGQGSSKRFKLVVIKAGVPVDLHFNTYAEDLVFSSVPDGAIQPDDMFRFYRFLIKWGNGTGTNTADGTDSAARISGFNVVAGDENGAPILGLSFETSTSIEGYLLNKPDNNLQGSVVDPFWDPNEFGTFSPAMYSLTTDDRTKPIGGFWDKHPAGIYPGVPSPDPNVAPPTTISSNTITTNYVNVKSVTGASSLPTYAGDFFGDLMYYGVLSEDDPGLLPVGIYINEEGDPSEESGLFAWWDGDDYRWGVAPNFKGPEDSTAWQSDPDGWDIVDPDDLACMAANILDGDTSDGGPEFEIAYADDVAGLNVDVFVKLDANYAADTPFTIRLNTTAAPVGTPGNWVTRPHKTLEEIQSPDTPSDCTISVLTDSDSDSGGGGGGGGGCTIGTGSAWNITMPAILAALLGYGLVRRRRKH